MSETKRYMIWDKLGNTVYCDSHDSYEEAKIQYVDKLIDLHGYEIGEEELEEETNEQLWYDGNSYS